MRLILIIVLNTFCTAAQKPAVAEWKNDNCFRNATWSYAVRDCRTGEQVIAHQDSLQVIPASTLKILTSAAVLETLGENFRYPTEIGYNGTITSGVLDGDLLIKGSGDPSLRSAYFPGGASITDTWAEAIKKEGISEIKGFVIGDASAVPQQINGSWLWEDVSNYFGAAPCGLNYNDNRFNIHLSSGTTGSRASVVSADPSYLNNTYTLSADVIASGREDHAYVYGDPVSFSKRISGTIPPEKMNFIIKAALPDPALLCAEQLFQSLKKLGIKCDEKKIRSVYQKKENPEIKKVIVTTYSPPLRELIYFTNMHSDNFYCEALLNTLGKGLAGNGTHEVLKFWHQKGIDSSSIFMADGCGLSRANTVSAGALTAALVSIAAMPTTYKAFYPSLPAAGKEGSMRSIGKGTALEGNMRAKTGYMQRVRAYAGYLKTRSGRDLAFSVIVNHYNCSAGEARVKLSRLMTSLYEL